MQYLRKMESRSEAGGSYLDQENYHEKDTAALVDVVRRNQEILEQLADMKLRSIFLSPV